MKEQLLKTSGADVLSPRKKLRKTLWGDSIPPSPLYVRGLTQPSFLFVSYVANGHDDGEHNDDKGNEDYYEEDYPIWFVPLWIKS